MSSTTLASPLMAHEQVCAVQDAVLREWFSPVERVQLEEFIQRMYADTRAFVDEHIRPRQADYVKQLETGDRWQPIAVIEEPAEACAAFDRA